MPWARSALYAARVDSETMRGAVIVDSREAAREESGDVLLAKARSHAELGELLGGKEPMPNAEVTVFKSLGTGG